MNMQRFATCCKALPTVSTAVFSSVSIINYQGAVHKGHFPLTEMERRNKQLPEEAQSSSEKLLADRASNTLLQWTFNAELTMELPLKPSQQPHSPSIKMTRLPEIGHNQDTNLGDYPGEGEGKEKHPPYHSSLHPCTLQSNSAFSYLDEHPLHSLGIIPLRRRHGYQLSENWIVLSGNQREPGWFECSLVDEPRSS